MRHCWNTEQCMPPMTIWCMDIACWITKATDTHTECVILIASPLQHWSKCSSVYCSHMHCLSCLTHFSAMCWFMLEELLHSYFVLPSDFLTISIVHVHHFCHILYRKYLFNYIVPNIPVIQYKVDVKVFVNLWLRIWSKVER